MAFTWPHGGNFISSNFYFLPIYYLKLIHMAKIRA
jgi:hypothetical protein